MLTLISTPRQAEDASSEIVDGQSIIINLRTGAWVALNPTGSYLWQRLDGQTPLQRIAAELAEIYQVKAAITEADVLVLATELVQEGMIADEPRTDRFSPRAG